MRQQVKVGWTVAVFLVGAGAGVAYAQDNDPLAELAALGSAMADASQPQAGGSIRAKREVDPTLAKRLKDPKNLEAKVEAVKPGKFPAAAVVVKVTQPAKEGTGKGVNKNDSLVIVPRFKVEKGQVLMTDADTVINAGSFYLQSGDKVSIRLGEKRDRVWEAEYIERM
jgi:hypothetical protein